MSIFFIPALLALLFKLVVLGYVFRGGQVSRLFLTLVVVFAIHNSIELLGYFDVVNGNSATVFFRLYYVATIYLLLYVLMHALAVSALDNQKMNWFLVACGSGLSALILFTDGVVAGQYSISYTMTAVKGPFYGLFGAFLLIALVSSLAALISGHIRAKRHIEGIRCLYSLAALAPIILTLIIAYVFKVADVGVNLTGLMPIATTLFLAIVLKTESKHKLSDLRRYLPLSLERKTTHAMMDLLDEYIQNSSQTDAYRSLQANLEKEIIKYSIEKCDGNVSHATAMMGLKNRSTLYSMLNRLEMNLSEIKGSQAD